MLCAVGAGDGDGDISRWFGIKNNGERGGGAGFCGEEIAGAVGGAGLGNGETTGGKNPDVACVFQRVCVAIMEWCPDGNSLSIAAQAESGYASTGSISSGDALDVGANFCP